MTLMEEQLLKACAEDPDPVNVAAYQDWLAENGRALDAEAVAHTRTVKLPSNSSRWSADPGGFAMLKGCVLAKCEQGVYGGFDSLEMVLVTGQKCRLHYEQD